MKATVTRLSLATLLNNSGLGLTFAVSRKIVGVIFDELTEALASGKRVEIRGMGYFKVGARKGALSKKIKFNCSTEILKRINGVEADAEKASE